MRGSEIFLSYNLLRFNAILIRRLAFVLLYAVLRCNNDTNIVGDDLLDDAKAAAAWAKRGIPPTFPLDKDIPIIVWWTGRLFLGSDGELKELDCGGGEDVCYSTRNRSYGAVGRGFIFYGTDLDPEDLPLPRLPHHEWALVHEESPMNNYMLTHAPMVRLFNHTATFRRESDYPITTHSLPSIDYLLRRAPVPLATKNRLRREDGLAPVVYVQSHCDVPSDRDRYVTELMKYIDVDSYGRCVNNRELPESLRDPVSSMHSDDFHDFVSRYKFQLAFENAVCPDYVTEKLFRTFHVGAVPVYRGSARVRDLVPDRDRSVVVADDFATPRDLAAFLTRLDGDDAAYGAFLDYKTRGVTNADLVAAMESREWGVNDFERPSLFGGFECHVCRKIAERRRREREHAVDPSVALMERRMADRSHLECPQPHASVGDLSRGDGWLRINWIDDYWTGLDKSIAVQEMILNNDTDSKGFLERWLTVMRRLKH